MRIFLAFVLVAGCGGGNESPSRSTAPGRASIAPADPRVGCADAIAKAGKTGRGAEPMSPDDARFTASIEAAMTDSCVEAQWSAAAVSCFATGSSQDELRACLRLLTPAQNEELTHRLADAADSFERTPPAPTSTP